jgi:hypothetical protein
MNKFPSAWQSGIDANREEDRNRPAVIDFDDGEIAVRLNGKQLRSWIYNDDAERRTKMLCAREYVEGWCDGRSQ